MNPRHAKEVIIGALLVIWGGVALFTIAAWTQHNPQESPHVVVTPYTYPAPNWTPVSK